MVLFLIFIVAILFITNLSFSVWEQLQQKPQWLIWIYASGFFLISLVFGRVIWRLLMPKSRKGKKSKEQQLSITHNIEATTQRLDEMSQKILSQNKRAQNKQVKEKNLQICLIITREIFKINQMKQKMLLLVMKLNPMTFHHHLN